MNIFFASENFGQEVRKTDASWPRVQFEDNCLKTQTAGLCYADCGTLNVAELSFLPWCRQKRNWGAKPSSDYFAKPSIHSHCTF